MCLPLRRAGHRSATESGHQRSDNVHRFAACRSRPTRSAASLARRLRARDRRRGAVRRAVARPLRDRRLDLPDHAGRRAGAANARRDVATALAHRARAEGAGAAARRRHLPVRPDHRRRAGDRQQQVSPPHARARCRRRTVVVEPGVVLDHLNAELQAARPLVSGRCLDQRPGDPRRHGRQQFLRLALDRLRQHGAQRAGASSAGCRTAALVASGRCRMRARGAEIAGFVDELRAIASAARRDRGALAQGAAPGRRLQPRHLATGANGPTPSTTASISPTCWSGPRARSPTPSA